MGWPDAFVLVGGAFALAWMMRGIAVAANDDKRERRPEEPTWKSETRTTRKGKP